MRKKVIGVLLTCILSLSIGMTFALSNPGMKILSWYEDQFQTQEKILNNTTTQKLSSALKKLHEQIPSMNQTISKTLTNFQNTTLLESKNSIKEHNDRYLTQLHTVTEEIEEQNPKEMADYTEQKKQQETEQITQDVQDILEDLLNK